MMKASNQIEVKECEKKPALGKEKRVCFEWIGLLTQDTIPELWETRARFFEKRHPLEFDLKRLEKSDSAGVAFFVSLMREAKSTGVSIHFTNLPQQFIDIVHLCGLEALFGIMTRS